ncbi:MAG: signal peptidase I [Gammaproteobacteria bacterium]
MDFSLVLVLLTVAMGLVWVLDALVLKPRRAASSSDGEPAKEPALVEFSRSFFPIVLVVLLIRSFAYEPFRIPSSSMMPTLRVGDFIFVSKFSYGLRLPVLNTKILALGEPERGDVAVFRLPSDPATNYIKRIIGVPGDIVTMREKRLWINGRQVPLELQDERVDIECGGFWFSARPATETIGPNSHTIYLGDQRDRSSAFLNRPVPEGQYLVMGDNRDCSRDGRVIGYIPEGNLVGRAVRIWMNWDAEAGRPLWHRIGDPIR